MSASKTKPVEGPAAVEKVVQETKTKIDEALVAVTVLPQDRIVRFHVSMDYAGGYNHSNATKLKRPTEFDITVDMSLKQGHKDDIGMPMAYITIKSDERYYGSSQCVNVPPLWSWPVDQKHLDELLKNGRFLELVPFVMSRMKIPMIGDMAECVGVNDLSDFDHSKASDAVIGMYVLDIAERALLQLLFNLNPEPLLRK